MGSRSMNRSLLCGGYFLSLVVLLLNPTSAMFFGLGASRYKCFMPSLLVCGCLKIYCQQTLLKQKRIFNDEAACFKNLVDLVQKRKEADLAPLCSAEKFPSPSPPAEPSSSTSTEMPQTPAVTSTEAPTKSYETIVISESSTSTQPPISYTMTIKPVPTVTFSTISIPTTTPSPTTAIPPTTIPTTTIPTATIATVTIPTTAVPTATIATVTIPTTTVPTATLATVTIPTTTTSTTTAATTSTTSTAVTFTMALKSTTTGQAFDASPDVPSDEDAVPTEEAEELATIAPEEEEEDEPTNHPENDNEDDEASISPDDDSANAPNPFEETQRNADSFGAPDEFRASESRKTEKKKKLRGNKKNNSAKSSKSISETSEKDDESGKNVELDADTQKLLNLSVKEILENPKKTGKQVGKVIMDVFNGNSAVMIKYKKNITAIFGDVMDEINKNGGFSLDKLMGLFSSLGQGMSFF